MSFIHHSSTPATKSELDVFQVPPTQTAIEDTYEVEFDPTSSLDATRHYEFNIPASDDYTDISSTYIQIVLKVTKEDGSDLDGAPQSGTLNDFKKVYPAKYLFNTLWEQVDIILGTWSASIDNVFNGQLPKRFVLGFVSSETFNGSINNDPFDFSHHNISYLVANVNGKMIPTIPYTPNFSENLYARQFYNFFSMLNQNEGYPSIIGSYDNFINKNALFAFDLLADNSNIAETGTLSLLQRGSIRVEVKFKASLIQPIYMLSYAQFDSLIQIDKFRNIQTDY